MVHFVSTPSSVSLRLSMRNTVVTVMLVPVFFWNVKRGKNAKATKKTENEKKHLVIAQCDEGFQQQQKRKCICLSPACTAHSHIIHSLIREQQQ